MFNMVEEIISFVVGGVLLVTSIVGFIVSTLKSIKNKGLANTSKKTNEISNLATDKIIEVEKLYSQAAQVLKVMGIPTGAIKKENVMNFIESQCSERDVKFDPEYWSAKVEKLVSLMNTAKTDNRQDNDNA